MLGSSWDQHGGRTSVTPAGPNLDGGVPADDVRSELDVSAGEACPPDAGAYRSSVIRLLPGCCPGLPAADALGVSSGSEDEDASGDCRVRRRGAPGRLGVRLLHRGASSVAECGTQVGDRDPRGTSTKSA